jgi:hypothetical protein
MKREHEDETRARLEQHAEVLRTQLGQDVEALAHTPVVATARAAQHSVQRARETVKRIGPLTLGLLGAFALLTLALLRREVARLRRSDRPRGRVR